MAGLYTWGAPCRRKDRYIDTLLDKANVIAYHVRWLFLGSPPPLSHVHTTLPMGPINPFDRQGHFSSARPLNDLAWSKRRSWESSSRVLTREMGDFSIMPGTEVNSIHFGRRGQWFIWLKQVRFFLLETFEVQVHSSVFFSHSTLFLSFPQGNTFF